MKNVMKEAKNILQLNTRVAEAVRVRDFDALALLNREVHQVISQLLAEGQPNAAARKAALLLQVTHQRAVALVQAELQRLETVITHLSDRRAGWEAYAQYSDAVE